jgi:hypothetical protein
MLPAIENKVATREVIETNVTGSFGVVSANISHDWVIRDQQIKVHKNYEREKKRCVNRRVSR